MMNHELINLQATELHLGDVETLHGGPLDSKPADRHRAGRDRPKRTRAKREGAKRNRPHRQRTWTATLASPARAAAASLLASLHATGGARGANGGDGERKRPCSRAFAFALLRSLLRGLLLRRRAHALT
jgi:hypothetical protein